MNELFALLFECPSLRKTAFPLSPDVPKLSFFSVNRLLKNKSLGERCHEKEVENDTEGNCFRF